MAASGIAEHNEARRREMGYLRKAYIQRELENQRPIVNQGIPMGQPSDALPPYQQSPYGRQMRHPGRSNSKAAKLDRERRQHHNDQAAIDYSAKLDNRYTSINYMSQW